MFFCSYFFVKWDGQKVHCQNAKEITMNYGQIVMALKHGKMEEYMSENFKMVKEKDREP